MREAAGSDRCPAQVLLQAWSQDLQHQHRLDACHNVSRLPCYIITPSQTVVGMSSSICPSVTKPGPLPSTCSMRTVYPSHLPGRGEQEDWPIESTADAQAG